MGLENLTENSTPCEICRELGLADDRYTRAINTNITCNAMDSAFCLQKDRAMIYLLYQNYLTLKKNNLNNEAKN